MKLQLLKTRKWRRFKFSSGKEVATTTMMMKHTLKVQNVLEEMELLLRSFLMSFGMLPKVE